MDPSIFDGETPGEMELNRLVQQAKAAMAWRNGVNALRGRASHEGVEAQVSASGGVVDIEVNDAACAQGGTSLAERVLDSVLAAQQDLAVQLRNSAVETFGEDSSQARTVANATETRFGRATVLEPLPESDRA